MANKRALRKKQRRKRNKLAWEAKMCDDKKSFYSSKDASVSASNIHRSGGPKMRWYKCPCCDKWHLTSQKEK